MMSIYDFFWVSKRFCLGYNIKPQINYNQLLVVFAL
jgi:hypothetical protein